MHCIAYATTDLKATDLWEDSLLGNIFALRGGALRKTAESRDCTIDCKRIILTEYLMWKI